MLAGSPDSMPRSLRVQALAGRAAAGMNAELESLKEAVSLKEQEDGMRIADCIHYALLGLSRVFAAAAQEANEQRFNREADKKNLAATAKNVWSRQVRKQSELVDGMRSLTPCAALVPVRCGGKGSGCQGRPV